MRFNNVFGVKAILVILATILLGATAAVYSTPPNSLCPDTNLRLPIGTEDDTYKHIKESFSYGSNHDTQRSNAVGFKNGDGLRRIGLNISYLPSEETIDYTQLVEAFDNATISGRATDGLTTEDIKFLQIFSFIFNEEYYKKGTVSAYTNYGWRPELINPRVKAIIEHCDLSTGDKVLDVGCAFGYYVRALRAEGVNAEGLEISSYTLKQADSETVKYLHLLDNLEVLESLQQKEFDLIILKDVLEHIPENILYRFLFSIRQLGKKMLVLVPVTNEQGDYINKEDEHDLTHVVKRDKKWWYSILGSGCQILDGLNSVLKGNKTEGTLCVLFSSQIITTDILNDLDKQKQMKDVTESGL